MDETREPENELEQPEPEDAVEEPIEGGTQMESETIIDEADDTVNEVEESALPLDSDVTDEMAEDTPGVLADEDLPADESPVDEFRDEADMDGDEQESYSGDDFDLPLPEPDFDVVGALAQVSALSDVMAEQEALQSQEMAQVEAQRQAAVERAERRSSHYFPAPGIVTVERGRMASFVPALLLIVIGAYLTFLTTSSTDFSLDRGEILTGAGVVIGVLMLVDWLASGRWHYGSLFGGLSIILSVGVLYWLSLNDDPGAQGWPLVVCAIGVAAILSAILSAERRGIQAFAGLLLILAGAVGMVVTTEALGEEITDLAETAGPVTLIVIAVLLAIPELLRWRRG